MAAESSSSCSSVVSAEALTYALSKLGKPELVLKEEQKLAMFSSLSRLSPPPVHLINSNRESLGTRLV